MKAQGLQKRVVSLAAAFLLLLSATGCKQLDHFKVYDVEDRDVQHRVRLTGQFDTQGLEADVVTLTHFANPVAKTPQGQNTVKIKDRHAHLTWYAIKQPAPEPRRTVRFENQFGLQSIDLREPRFLLVPTRKTSDPDSQFPGRLDHYKCYHIVRVNVGPQAPPLRLEDQFGVQDNVLVNDPVLFCLPVVKEREGEQPAPIRNKRDHLAVYPITPQQVEKDVKYRNQFEEDGLRVRQSVWLGVPSRKRAVATHDN